MTAERPAAHTAAGGGRLDPITLTVLTSALSGVAEEMGTALVRSAYSSNIKERRDCSAALFDARGRMVAQAEHIPVHLGAMPEAVAAVMERGPGSGDVFVLNDPFSGGNHLPDITMVSRLGTDQQTWGYAVTRAHHSDVGGMQPGSMPAGSRDIWSEGLGYPASTARACRRLCSGRAGADPGQHAHAAAAAGRLPGPDRGEPACPGPAGRPDGPVGRRHGLRRVRRGSGVYPAAHPGGGRCAARRRYAASSQIEGDGVTDEDIPIRVAVRVAGDRIVVDFAGTAGAVDGNVNCPLSVTRSACFFALRVLLPDDVPANSGTYAPLEIIAPEGSLVNARPPFSCGRRQRRDQPAASPTPCSTRSPR